MGPAAVSSRNWHGIAPAKIAARRGRLEFERLHRYRDPFGIGLPITLSAGRQRTALAARVDTGAPFCVFERAYGEHIGLRIEEGELKWMGTAGGARFRVSGHLVTLEFLGYSLDSMAYFAEDVGFHRDVLG